MNAAVDPAIFREPLIILCAAGIIVPLFHRVGVTSVLGFILVGVALGPHGLGEWADEHPWLSLITIPDDGLVRPVAEFGVVLLLFMIGLELTFERLKTLRKLVFGFGSAQVALCAAALAVVVRLTGHSASASVVIGMALAMSSTAIAVQVLSEARQLGSASGRASFAVLLFQDLAVVPMLFAIGTLGQEQAGVGLVRFSSVVGQAFMAIAGTIFIGRLVLRPLFRGVGRTRSPELFMAACLLVVAGASLATALAGLSMALGALIAGLLLAETEYSRQVEVVIEPFKGLLLGVFLVSIGMSIDPGEIALAPFWVFGAAAGLVVLKLAIIVALARWFGLSWSTGLKTGLLLGPAGEFSFVILATSVAFKLLTQTEADFALILCALTMASLPILYRFGAPLARRLEPPRIIDPALMPPERSDGPPRVIIAGFGRVGQTVAAMLDVHRIPYLAVDRDVDRVARQRKAGKPVYYGDSTRVELLRRLGLGTARALVVTLDADREVDAVVEGGRGDRPELLIVARARDAKHAAHLYQAGASVSVPETIEASLQLCEALLVDLGVPMGPVIASIHEKRSEFQAQVKSMAPAAEVRQLRRRRLRDAAPQGVS